MNKEKYTEGQIADSTSEARLLFGKKRKKKKKYCGMRMITVISQKTSFG